MAAITGQIVLNVNTTDTLPAGANRPAAVPIPLNPPNIFVQFQPGTGPGQANKQFYFKNSAAAAPVDLDFTACTCMDLSTGFTHIRALIVTNFDPVNTLIVGLGSNPIGSLWWNGTNPARVLQPGEILFIFNMLAATGFTLSGSAKGLRVDPGGNTILYSIQAWGD